MNLYSYALQDPVNFVDPDGLAPAPMTPVVPPLTDTPCITDPIGCMQPADPFDPRGTGIIDEFEDRKKEKDRRPRPTNPEDEEKKRKYQCDAK